MATEQLESKEANTEEASNGGNNVMYVISSYIPTEENQLRLQVGEIVEVLERVNDKWWWVECGGEVGYAPTNHIAESRPDPEEEEDHWENEEYFGSYGHMKLHQEMLTDTSRTLAYKTAIERAAYSMKDKVVLDVGCGTGILSLFCAEQGQAGKVYAVEQSEMAEYTREIVSQNGYRDVIEVIQSRVEDAQLPDQVDFIVSEWMGTLLLFEMMVESVIIARDKYLKQDGVIWPSQAELFLAPCSAEKQFINSVTMWNDVYGFNFSSLGQMASEELHGRPIHDHQLSLDDLLAADSTVLKMDMATITVPDLEMNEATFDYLITKQGTLHGFASWFTVTFAMPSSEASTSSPPDVLLSTSPHSPLTHWKQDLLLLDQSLEVRENDRVRGVIRVSRHKMWRRHLQIKLRYTQWREEEIITPECSKTFALWRP